MISGFLLINKKEGITTNSINNLVKKKLNIKKVGHIGTLDPFASGLVILAINEATKFIPYVDDTYKSYIGTIKLGEYTSTLDNTSEVIERKNVNKYSINEINSILNSFLGKSKQIPPRYSAKSINGVRAYDLARDNKEFELKEIDIEIKEISLIKYDEKNNTIKFSCVVSKGTYIRSLALDIAKKLNTTGHLISLVRETIGRYSLSNAINEEDISFTNIISIEEFIPFDIYEIDTRLYSFVKNGNQVNINSNSDYLLLTYKGKLMALYKKRYNNYVCERKINDEYL